MEKRPTQRLFSSRLLKPEMQPMSMYVYQFDNNCLLCKFCVLVICREHRQSVALSRKLKGI